MLKEEKPGEPMKKIYLTTMFIEYNADFSYQVLRLPLLFTPASYTIVSNPGGDNLANPSG